MGTPKSQEFSGQGDLTNLDLSSFPEYKAECTCPSIPTYQGLSWGGQCPGQKEIKIMASLVALIIWNRNTCQIFGNH